MVRGDPLTSAGRLRAITALGEFVHNFAGSCNNLLSSVLFLKMVFVTRRKTQRGDCNRGTAGFAYVGGACVVNKRLEKVIENLLQDLLMIFVNR